MKRPLRIILEVLGPPALGLLPFYAMMAPDLIAEIAYGHVNLQEHLVIVMGAYIVAGIPSILYTLAMETAFSRCLSPRSWRAVMLSVTLGLVFGVLIGAIMNFLDSGRDGEPHFIKTMLPLGLLVGLLMGILVRILTKRDPRQRITDNSGADCGR